MDGPSSWSEKNCKIVLVKIKHTNIIEDVKQYLNIPKKKKKSNFSPEILPPRDSDEPFWLTSFHMLSFKQKVVHNLI